MFECFKRFPDKECYLNLPDDMVDTDPLDMENIIEQQDTDDALLQHATKYVDWYMHKCIGTIDDILCYIKPGDPPNNWKIALPKSLLQPTIEWFHHVTGHPGRKSLFMQMSSWYYHRDIWSLIDKFHCKHCQRNKLSGTGYGLLPERKLRSVPFEECAFDLIGPWIIQIRDKLYKFNALTVIDTVSNLVELVRIDEKTSAHVARKYTQVWLSRYPWPEHCVHNNGGEFVVSEFQFLLQGCWIKDAPVSSKNPLANAICEWMHQTVGNVLWNLLHSEPPQDVTKAKDFIDEAFLIATHAMHISTHTTLGSSPGSLVFNRGMFLNIPLIADWHAITQKCENFINENLMRENCKQKWYDYVPNQKVLKKRHKTCKLSQKTSGPYKIMQTHVNRTVTIELKPRISERINILRVISYK